MVMLSENTVKTRSENPDAHISYVQVILLFILCIFQVEQKIFGKVQHRGPSLARPAESRIISECQNSSKTQIRFKGQECQWPE